LLPGILWMMGFAWVHPAVLGAVAVGEILDRALFYAELRFLDPPLQVERDLERLLS
jgi:hypothetical protein